LIILPPEIVRRTTLAAAIVVRTNRAVRSLSRRAGPLLGPIAK